MAAGAYIDTSALGRVLLGEPDAPAVLAALAEVDQQVSSRLMRVELRRLALRHDRVADADQLAAAVALLPVTEAVLADAESVAPVGVGTLDAIHLVTALSLRDAGVVDRMLTYDLRLADAARHHGLAVVAPA